MFSTNKEHNTPPPVYVHVWEHTNTLSKKYGQMFLHTDQYEQSLQTGLNSQIMLFIIIKTLKYLQQLIVLAYDWKRLHKS